MGAGEACLGMRFHLQDARGWSSIVLDISGFDTVRDWLIHRELSSNRKFF